MKRFVLITLLSCSTLPAQPSLSISPIEAPKPSAALVEPEAPVDVEPAQNPRPYDLISVWGSSATDIYILGQSDNYAVFHSTDQGKTWQKQVPDAKGGSLHSVWGYSPQEVYLIGRGGQGDIRNFMLQSTDQGNSWKEDRPTLGSFSEDLPGVYSYGDRDDDGPITTKGHPERWPTATAGKPWRAGEEQLTCCPPYDYTESAVLGSGKGDIIILDRTLDHYSSNAGKTWTTSVRNRGMEDALSIWGSSAHNLYAVLENAVAHSTDLGVIWTVSPIDASLNYLWGSGANDIYLIGDKGTILHSVDRGKTWPRAESGVDKSLLSIWGSDKGDVYIVGEAETILHSVDQGKSWQKLSLSVPPKTKEDTKQKLPKGISLGIYYEKAGRTYEPMIDEIAALGADHLELLVHIWQSGQNSNVVYQWPKLTISDGRLDEVIEYAHRKGLKVFLYPLLNLTSHGGWRGTIAPTDWNKWWASYQKIMLHYAAIAQENGVELFSIGSEMTSAESMHEQWVSLIQETRKVFSGELVYAANWDRYSHLSFEQQLDYVGIDAYFPLTDKDDPSYGELVSSWRKYKEEIISWQKKSGRALLMTELGYRSNNGANQRPWEYGSGGTLDLDEQLLCYRAFREVWQDEAALKGVYLWGWSKGGKQDTGYSPRGKPAEAEIKDWFLSQP